MLFLHSAYDAVDRKISALAPYSWVEASHYTVDGGTGNVASFPDKVAPGTGIRAITANHAFAASGSLQVAVPTTDANLNGRLAALFTGTQGYLSNSAASSWTHCHDGTGVTHYAVLVPTATLNNATIHTVGGTIQFASANTGAAFTWRTNVASPGGAIAMKNNGSSASTISTQGTLTNFNVACVLSWNYSETTSPEFEFRRKTTVATSGSTANAPSSSASSSTMALGYSPAGNEFTKMEWAASINFKGNYSAANTTAILAWALAKYGIA